MNYGDTVEDVLSIKLLYEGQELTVKELPVDTQIEYLIDEHFELFISSDFKLWRLENIYSITTKSGKKQKFKLNAAQLDFCLNYLSRGFTKFILLKSRQLGFTTLAAIYFLDEIIFHPNREALQIAHTQKDATALFTKKIQYAVRNLPKPVTDLYKVDQNKSGRFQISTPSVEGGTAVSAISVSNSGRSGTYNYVHISELAKLSKDYPARADEIVTGTIPAVPVSNSLVIIESTAEGVSGLFYEKYMAAFKRKDKITPAHTVAEFYPVFYNWRWDKEQIHETCVNGTIRPGDMEECEIDWVAYQQEYELTDEELTFYYTKYIGAERDINKLNQEYPTTEMDAFIATGANYFSAKKIFKELEKLGEQNYTTYDYDGNELYEIDKQYNEKFSGLMIFEQPQAGKNYVIGGDVAEGLMHGDWSTISVVGYDKKVKAIYRGRIEPDDYAKLVFKVGKMYNNALMGVEFNKDGNWVNTELVRMEYPNMYFRTSVDDINQTVTKSYGWLTNSKTRPNALGEVKRHFNECESFPYKIILDEMVTFVRDKRGKPQAQSGKHDDVIMSLSIAFGMLAGKVESQQAASNDTWHHLLWR